MVIKITSLYNNNQLVQVMTFGKARYTIKNYQYELLRLCSHKRLPGSWWSSLFKYFTNNYQPISVISYCDISKFTGKVYERLGFNLKNNKLNLKKFGQKIIINMVTISI